MKIEDLRRQYQTKLDGLDRLEKMINRIRTNIAEVAERSGLEIADVEALIRDHKPAGRAGGGVRNGMRTKRVKKGVRTPVAPKYQNPHNASEKWSGRGKPPRWLAAFEQQGMSREQFLIDKQG